MSLSRTEAPSSKHGSLQIAIDMKGQGFLKEREPSTGLNSSMQYTSSSLERVIWYIMMDLSSKNLLDHSLLPCRLPGISTISCDAVAINISLRWSRQTLAPWRSRYMFRGDGEIIPSIFALKTTLPFCLGCIKSREPLSCRCLYALSVVPCRVCFTPLSHYGHDAGHSDHPHFPDT